MKYKKEKTVVIALAVLAAGICYSLSRGTGDADGVYLSEALVETEAGQDHKTALPMEEKKTAEADTGQEPAGNGGVQEAGQKETMSCYVHICGEVISPGVYELEEGSRVFQAVEKAGGFTEDAAREYLNMAERISDGMKIVVLNKAEAEAAALEETALPKEATGPLKVNLNTATKEELMSLKGIGESRAEDIIRFRESHGDFKKIEDVMKVSGIKDAAFEKIKEDITV